MQIMRLLESFWFRLRHPRAVAQFTEDVRRAMGVAGEMAWRCCSDEVAPIHLLWGLMHSAELHQETLTRAGLGRDGVTVALEDLLRPQRTGTPASIPTSTACGAIVCRAIDLATGEGMHLVSANHLFKALVGAEDHEVQSFIASTRA